MALQSRKKNRSIFVQHAREFQLIVLMTITFFLICAFYSYKAQDPSWCYYTTEHNMVANWCGPMGANSASILFYLFGSAALLFLPFLFFVMHGVIQRFSWAAHGERYISWFFLIPVSAALCQLHSIRLFANPSTGGYIGRALYEAIHLFLDRMGSALVLYMLLSMSIVLIMRFSFLSVIIFMITFFKKAYRLMCRYRVMQKIGHLCVYLAYALVRPAVWFYALIKKMLDGSLFEKAGVLAPADDVFQNDVQKNRASISLVIPDASEVKNHSLTAPQLPRVPMVVPARPVEKKVYEDRHKNEKTETKGSVFSEKSSEEKEKLAPVYAAPGLDIFVGVAQEKDDHVLVAELEQRAHVLEEKLERFGVSGKVVAIKRGPVVTLFEYQPAIDTKISKILTLEDDLAMALKALSIRILAPIPGKAVVGFEVANKKRKDVLLVQAIQSPEYQQHGGSLPLVLGEDSIGNQVVVDLARMPHLLIAGSTGSGKSVALNTMLMSLLCKCSPDDVRLILIDPKRLEFASYADIAHLIFPIVVDPRKAAPVLKWVVGEMETRYQRMSLAGARSIFDYNQRVSSDDKLPFIVVVIDELADLMMTAGRDIEDLIARIAQMARAAGIHMLVATQRPSVDVITGLIKVNFPSRISFRVTSKIDSRTILDCGGAEKLLGRGDMLFLDSTNATLRRVHGAYVSDEEIMRAVSHIRAERPTSYLDLEREIKSVEPDIPQEDEQLFENVRQFIDELEEISISLLQRKFRIGYNRSARMMEILEQRGKIMPADGAKMRKVIR